MSRLYIPSIALALGCLSSLVGLAQTFALDQFDQLFRPLVRMEARCLPAVGL